MASSTALPSEYKRAIFKTQGRPLTIESTPLILPQPGQILVRVEACGVCHSDIFARDNSFGGGLPRVPGHEIIGKIAAVPEGEKEWTVGERVGGAWHAFHDGTCRSCKSGLFQMCESETINGISRDGGYQEYVLLHTIATLRIPEHLDAATYAPILCAGVTTFNALRQMSLAPGALVAVQGIGGLGHLALQYARKSGYRTIALTRNSDKDAFAKELGAHHVIAGTPEEQAAGLKALGGASCVMATAPQQGSIGPLVAGLKPLGKLLILGVAGDEPLSTGMMITSGISVHGWPSGTTLDAEETLDFTELQGIETMVQRFPFEKAQEAFDAMLDGSVRFRAVIVFD